MEGKFQKWGKKFRSRRAIKRVKILFYYVSICFISLNECLLWKLNEVWTYTRNIMTAFNIVHGRKLLEFMGRKFYFDVDEKKMCMQKQRTKPYWVCGGFIFIMSFFFSLFHRPNSGWWKGKKFYWKVSDGWTQNQKTFTLKFAMFEYNFRRNTVWNTSLHCWHWTSFNSVRKVEAKAFKLSFQKMFSESLFLESVMISALNMLPCYACLRC